jgi:hypothetical protein
MHWLIVAVVAVALLLAYTAEAAPPRSQAAGDLYVSPKGRDTWSGTLPDPNRAKTDGPFATLERARDAVRGLKTRGGHAQPMTVLIRSGEYRIAKPFTLRPEDSGAEARPVTYAAYPGEHPVFTGGRHIAGWRRAEGDVWTTEIAEVKAGKEYFRQLFVNGTRRERARYPSEKWVTVAGAADYKDAGWAGALSGQKDDEVERRSFKFRPGDIRKDWTNIDDVEVVVLQFWMAPRLRIQSIDEAHSSVLFTGGSFRPLTWSFGYYVDNVYEGLGAPGSWYLNRKTGVLSYHAMPGEDMQKAEVVTGEARQLMRIEGDADHGRFVKHVTLRGLAFEHTTWDLPAEGYYYSQAELSPLAAIQATGALNCAFEDCEMSHLGGWGIELGRGCQDNRIVGCTVKDVAAGCVKIGEPEEPGSDAAEACRNVLTDNRFLDGSAVYLGAAAVWIGQSGGNTVSHNEFAGQFMWAASVGWNWAYFPLNRSRDNKIE